MRPGEHDGKDYHFVEDDEFDRMIDDGEFVEWAQVFGYRYGTPKAPVKDGAARGPRHLFDIDWQGARQLEPDFGEHLVTIFLLPPSMAELERRLRARGTDSREVIADRMRRAAEEISHWAEYEYVLVNDEMDECLARVRAIVAAERLKRVRQTSLVPTCASLIGPGALSFEQLQEAGAGHEIPAAVFERSLGLGVRCPIARAAIVRRR